MGEVGGVGPWSAVLCSAGRAAMNVLRHKGGGCFAIDAGQAGLAPQRAPAEHGSAGTGWSGGAQGGGQGPR